MFCGGQDSDYEQRLDELVKSEVTLKMRVIELQKREESLRYVTLAHSIAAEQCINVLVPLIQTADGPVKLAAIKMLNKVRLERTRRNP